MKVKIFVRLWPYFKKNKWLYLAGFSCLILTNIFGILIPYYLKLIIDGIQLNDRHIIQNSAILIALSVIFCSVCPNIS
ncbi:MAG: hypothetical protein HYS98_05245 [Deltaproteobacteria bacterium]|nr:hypothetical protein [Deltaproteobacteria bacterium]